MISLLLGDCLVYLKDMESNSVDSIITDPPYGISFMAKKWDYDIPSIEIWKECLRVLKPGGHLLSFGGSRTFHRIAVSIEDAGFDIRDTIMWIYGSGFPKSLNIGKAIDKRGGNSLLAIDISKKLKEARTSRNITLKKADDMFCNGSTNYSWFEGRPKGIRIPEPEEFAKIVNAWPEMQEYYDKTFPADRIVLETKVDNGKRTVAFLGTEENIYTVSEASTDLAKQWDGWGTALKPSFEPIIMARKPFIGTVSDNVLAYGTGGINIDATRIPTEDDLSGGTCGGMFGQKNEDGTLKKAIGSGDKGRWPANILHDGSDEVLDLMPHKKSGKMGPEHNRHTDSSPNGIYGKFDKNHPLGQTYGDAGSAARFFYCAKTSKTDRNEGCEDLEEKSIGDKGNGLGRVCETCGSSILKPCQCPDRSFINPSVKNNHPTVKPTELMKYLCRLITPLNGIVLDPFMGSGSTGKAASLEGFSFIGIEMDEEYFEIAKRRVNDGKGEKNEK